MSRPRERVRLQDGLKLDLNKLIRQKLVRPGSKTGTGIRWSIAIRARKSSPAPSRPI